MSWPEHRTLNARIAIGVTPTGAAQPILGTIEVAFDSRTELAERIVMLTEPKARVSALSVGRSRAVRAHRGAHQGSARVDGRKARAACDGRARPARARRRRRAARPVAAPAIDNTPPRIFVSDAPGEPRRVRRRARDGADRGHDAVVRGEHELGRVQRRVDQDVVPAQQRRLARRARRQRDRGRPPARCRPPSPLFRTTATSPTSRSSIPGPRIHARYRPDDLRVDRAGGDHRDSTARRNTRRSPAPRCRMRRTPTPRCSATAAAASTTSCRAAGSRQTRLDGPWTFATASLPPDFARIPANGPRGFVLVSVPGTAASARGADRSADPAAGDTRPRHGEARRGVRGRAAVRGDPRHADAIRGQHVVPRDPDGRRLLLVLPGRMVRRTCADRSLDARGDGARGDLHHSAVEPDVPVHVRARVRSDADDDHVRLHVRLHDELRQRRRSRLRHRLLLSAVHLSRADPDLLSVSVLVRGRHVLQLGDRCVGARRRDLRSVRRRREGGLRVQPQHRRVGARRRDLRSQRRRRRSSPRTTPPPAAMRTAAPCGVRTARRATRAGTTPTPDAPGSTQQNSNAYGRWGSSHDLRAEPDRAHAKPEQRARQRGLVQLVVGREGRRRFRAPAATAPAP